MHCFYLPYVSFIFCYFGVTVFNPSPFYALITTYIFIYFILPTRYSVLHSLYCSRSSFFFPRVAFSRGTNVPSRITGAEFAIPWALPILSSVLVFQDAFS